MPIRSIVPLPVEPAPPAVLSQDAIAQGAADLAETAKWRYHLRYWHQHAPQDEVFVTASFNNLPQDDMTITADDAPSLSEDRVIVQLVYSDGDEQLEALRLTREIGEAEPTAHWPDIEFLLSAGSVIDLGNGTGDSTVRTYTFDPPMASEGMSSRIGLTWGNLDVAHAQNARASLAAMRNRGLIAEGATTDVIVYRTATVDTPGVVTPHNRWPQDIDISELDTTVETALDAAFCTLFGDRQIGQCVKLEVTYGYQLSPQSEPDSALVTLPVTIVPRLTIAADTSAQIATVLATWKEEHQPLTTGGRWLLSLVQFSQIDKRAVMPLLELERLVYRLR